MNTSRPILPKPRAGASRMKIFADDHAAVATQARRTAADAVGSSKDATISTKARLALNELVNPNRNKASAGNGKENKSTAIKTVVAPSVASTHSTTTSAPTTSTIPSTRSRSASNAQQNAPRPIVQRGSSSVTNAAAKIPTSRHAQTQSSIASAEIFRPQARHRDDDDVDGPNAGSRKRARTMPTSRAASISASSASTYSASSSAQSFASGTTVHPDDDEGMELEHEQRQARFQLEDHVEEEDETVSDGLDVEAFEQHHFVEEIQDVQEDNAEATVKLPAQQPQSLSEPEPETYDPADWTRGTPNTEARYQAEIDAIKDTFTDDVDEWDTTMVSEYSEEIFEYMGKLEVQCLPDPNYMSRQTEVTWDMRTTLVDWLVQIHQRYHLLPETLWIAVNIIDRFLSKRVVSLVKVQLVGITAMFIAAKYEEIMAPSVDEFVFMTEGGYTKDEILKGERIIMQTLGFHISQYCSPYSWVRRISKADDYDIQTRTLSKFLMEVCLLDHRFLRSKPSMIAAVGMYTARRMLQGDWSDAFVFYSNFTEAQLLPGCQFILETLATDRFSETHTCRKYMSKKFLKASLFAREWALKFYEAEYEAAEAENDAVLIERQLQQDRAARKKARIAAVNGKEDRMDEL